MCDYSLHLVKTRPANVADKLVTTKFAGTITRGFAAVEATDVAVCLRPGTEIAFDNDVKYDDVMKSPSRCTIQQRTARFRQVKLDDPHAHHDALEFPDGQIVLLTSLSEGQHATVLQLPASSSRPNRAAEREEKSSAQRVHPLA
jgi:hypothetical protein